MVLLDTAVPRSKYGDSSGPPGPGESWIGGAASAALRMEERQGVGVGSPILVPTQPPSDAFFLD
jgi:hypothetical protein